MNKKEINVDYRIDSINERMFVLELDTFKEDKEIEIGFAFDVVTKVPEGEMLLVVGTKYLQEKKRVLECWYDFNFAIKDFNEFPKLSDQRKLIGIPNTFLSKLLNDAFWAMRGILHVRLQGAAGLPMLPTIDPDAMIAAREKMLASK